MPQSSKGTKANGALHWIELQLGDRPNDAGLWYGKGVLLAKAGKLENALKALDKVLWLDPEHLKALEAKGKALFKMERYLEAYDVFRKLVKKVRRDEEYWYYCGESLVKLGKREKAILYYDEALAVNPNHTDALYGRANAMRGTTDALPSSDDAATKNADISGDPERVGGESEVPAEIDHREVVIPDLYMDRTRRPADPPSVPTNIDLLDMNLQGGVSPGSIVLITGMPGTFKTSLCFWILFQQCVRESTKGLFITVEQSEESLLRHVTSMGIDPAAAANNLQILDLTRLRRDLGSDDLEPDWLDLLKERVLKVRRSGVQVLALDSLEALESLVAFEDRRRDLHRLFEFLRSLYVTSFLTAERYELDYEGQLIKVYDVPEYLADGVFELTWRERGGGDLQRALRVVKMRDRTHSTSLYFLYWDGGFKLAHALTAPPPSG